MNRCEDSYLAHIIEILFVRLDILMLTVFDHDCCGSMCSLGHQRPDRPLELLKIEL